jgi:hypothetical protein
MSYMCEYAPSAIKTKVPHPHIVTWIVMSLSRMTRFYTQHSSSAQWDVQTYCDSMPAMKRAEDIDESPYQATTGEEIEDSV